MIPKTALEWREKWEEKETRCDYERALRDVKRLSDEIAAGNNSAVKLARLERALREVQQARSEVEKYNVRKSQG
jgi:hypothetical protein